jgi:hypothetical protein
VPRNNNKYSDVVCIGIGFKDTTNGRKRLGHVA